VREKERCCGGSKGEDKLGLRFPPPPFPFNFIKKNFLFQKLASFLKSKETEGKIS